jgi:hypothetical protein
VSETVNSGHKVEPADFGTGKTGVAARWRAEVKLAQKAAKKWLEDCTSIERRYRDERRGSNAVPLARFNVLWSNIETLKPAVYARPPVPVVTRRFRDSDPVARAAAMIMQRCLQHSIEEGDLHHRVKQARDDYLLFARGTLWARYEPHFTQPDAPEGDLVSDDTESEDGEVSHEEVEWDFVHRDDFLHGMARTWAEVPWVGRRVRMTRNEGVERFGKAFEDVPLSWKPDGITDSDIDNDEQYQAFQRAVVYEIWDIDTRTVIWIADGCDTPLDTKPDPLGLEHFWPCPRPIYGTLTNQSLMPIPDYKEYEDQAELLDTLTGRISKISEAVKVTGVYDARWDALGRMFEEDTDNELVPVDQWSDLSSKGGMNAAFELVDVSKIVMTLQTLAEVRTQAKNDLYEITGIADILRGSTAPEETATAQRTKARFATLRLSDRQLEMARFVRDILRITGEIICKHFSPQMLLLASNFKESEIALDDEQKQKMAAQQQQAQMMGMPPPPSITEQALMLLKSERLREFRIDVEDQSTIAADDMEEKQSRVEFLAAIGNFLKEATMIPPALAPAMTPLLGKLLMFGVRGMRAGAEMETALEDAVTKLTTQAQQQAQQPQKPSPEEIKAQTDQQRMQMEAQMAQQQMQADAAKAQQDAQMKQQEMAVAAQQQQAQNAQDFTQHQIAIDKQQLDRQRFEHEQAQAERDHQIELMRIALDQQKLDLEHRKLSVAAATAAHTADHKDRALDSGNELKMKSLSKADAE